MVFWELKKFINDANTANTNTLTNIYLGANSNQQIINQNLNYYPKDNINKKYERESNSKEMSNTNPKEQINNNTNKKVSVIINTQNARQFANSKNKQ